MIYSILIKTEGGHDLDLFMEMNHVAKLLAAFAAVRGVDGRIIVSVNGTKHEEWELTTKGQEV